MAIHAVTAQPGGDKLVRQKLEEEGLDLSYPIHSDPELELLASDSEGKPSEEIFVHGQVDKSREYLDGVQTYEVQPALVVLDSDGKVTNWWSWKSLFSDPAELNKRLDDQGAIKAAAVEADGIDPALVPVSIQARGDSSADQNEPTWIINVRPHAGDLLPAILADQQFSVEEVLSKAEVCASIGNQCRGPSRKDLGVELNPRQPEEAGTLAVVSACAVTCRFATIQGRSRKEK